MDGTKVPAFRRYNSCIAFCFFFSTVSEAIRCSELMKAEHTILTHVSSRHLFPCESSSLPDRVTLAFDHMTVCHKSSSFCRNDIAWFKMGAILRYSCHISLAKRITVFLQKPGPYLSQ